MQSDDDGVKGMASAGAVLCVLTMAAIFFAGWRSDTAATVFVVCLMFLPLCAARLCGS